MSHRLSARAHLKYLKLNAKNLNPQACFKSLNVEADVQTKALAATERTGYASYNCER